MAKEGNCIRIGDVLCLADCDAGGFLTGNEDLPQRVFLEEINRFNPNESNHHLEMCQFHVFQRFQYGAWKELQDALSHFGITEMDQRQWADLMNSNDPLFADLRFKYENSRREKETNWMEFKRTAGHPVRYGSVIQLHHVDSKKFLTQSKDRAWRNRLAMELSLEQDGNQGSWWKLVATDKGCAEGDNVLYGDQVLLESLTFTNKFISVYCDTAASSGVKASAEDESAALVQALGSGHESVLDTLEANVCADFSKFKVIPIKSWAGSKLAWNSAGGEQEDGDEESLSVRGMDCVTLVRGKDQVLLYGQEDARRVVWVEDETVRKGEELHWASSLWRLKPCKMPGSSEALEGTNNSLKGGSGQGLVIQHVLSGLYLSEQDGALVLSESGRGKERRWQAEVPKQHSEGAESGGTQQLVDGASVWLKRQARKGQQAQWVALDVQGAKKKKTLKRKGLGIPQAHSLGNVLDLAAAVLREGPAPEGCDLLEVRVLPDSVVKPLRRAARCARILAAAVHLLHAQLLAAGFAPINGTFSPPTCRK